MSLPKGIQENLRFLTIEVGSQVANLRTYFRTGSVTVAKRILDRSGYTHNLKTTIQRNCHGRVIEGEGLGNGELVLRAIEAIATDLDRIAELCRDCIQQAGYVTEMDRLPTELYRSLLARIGKQIARIEGAILSNDTHVAVKIGEVEVALDRAFRKLMGKTIRRLKGRSKGVADRVRALFIAHAIEQMGDALRSTSEAIISANLGQPFSTDRYHSFRASIDRLDAVDEEHDLVLETIAETRSGGSIAGVNSSEEPDDGYLAIFKDGKKRKLKEERQGVESWHEIYPGLAPKILSYHRRGQSAALLIEHLAGLTFEQIVLHEPEALLHKARRQLQKTLKSIWRETHTRTEVAAGFMDQLVERLDGVYAHHSGFRQSEGTICGYALQSFDSLVEQARVVERDLEAPFSVYIHGDFNIDNIIYDPLENRINFIDLHRSSYMDYVQDVSVFMVSNYRLQVVNADLRRRILDLARDFYRFATRYAVKRGDETFELRLALGLARSFATSTRFILDETLAKAMFFRAKLLLELVLSSRREAVSEFRVPIEEIFVG